MFGHSDGFDAEIADHIDRLAEMYVEKGMDAAEARRAAQRQFGNTTLLHEDRRFPPAEEFRAKANLRDPSAYEAAQTDPESWWATWAGELHWFEP